MSAASISISSTTRAVLRAVRNGVATLLTIMSQLAAQSDQAGDFIRRDRPAIDLAVDLDAAKHRHRIHPGLDLEADRYLKCRWVRWCPHHARSRLQVITAGTAAVTVGFRE